jgi:hypothetical protein
MTLEPQKLSEIFGAMFGPTASLAFETPVDVYLDVLFDHTAAAAHRRELAPDRAAQPCWNRVPVVDPIAVTQDVAKEHVKLFWTTLAIWTGAQRFQDRLAVGFPDCAHDAAMFRLILANKSAHLQILSPSPI